MALAGDLARRLAAVAPLDSDPLKAHAIVLVDELELHLHPRWQRIIVSWLLETFPNCQFIVSTHSPQVISEVSAGHVRILEDTATGTRIHRHGPPSDATAIICWRVYSGSVHARRLRNVSSVGPTGRS